MNKTLIAVLLLVFTLTLVQSAPSQFGYNYLDSGSKVIEGANYSINVNNTENLQGRDTNQLYSYFESLFNSVYCRLTGCTMSGDIDFSNSAINNPNYVQFNTTFTDGSYEGRLQWNSEDGTLEVGMPGGNVNLQIGQETLIKAKASENILNGQLVYIDGADGSKPTISLAQANTENMSHKTIAMATEDINSGQQGYVTVMGLVRDVNTLGYPEGTPLYLSATTPGAYTNIEPSSPNYSVTIGYVVRTSATEGVILVSIHADIWKTEIANEYLKLDASNGPIIGDLNVSGNLTVGATFKLETPVETDIFFPAYTFKLPTSKAPESDVWTLNFDASTEEEVYSTYQIPHTRAFGTPLEPHFHWTPSDNSTGNVVWCVEWQGANIGANFSAPQTVCGVGAALGSDNQHILTYGGSIPDPGFGDSSMGKLRLYRDATNTSDTYTGDAKLLQFDVHIMVSRLGQEPVNP